MNNCASIDATYNRMVSFNVYAEYHTTRNNKKRQTRQCVSFKLKDVLLSVSDMYDLYRLSVYNGYDLGSVFRDTDQMIRFTGNVVDYAGIDHRERDLKFCLRHVNETWPGIGHRDIKATLEHIRRENNIMGPRAVRPVTIDAIRIILEWLLDRNKIYHRYQAVFYMTEWIQWPRKMPPINAQLYNDLLNKSYEAFGIGLMQIFNGRLGPPGSDCERLVLLYARIKHSAFSKKINSVDGPMDVTAMLSRCPNTKTVAWPILASFRTVYAAVVHYTNYMIDAYDLKYHIQTVEMLAVSDERKARDQSGKALGKPDFRKDFMDWLLETGMKEAHRIMTTEPAFCSEHYRHFPPWIFFKRIIYTIIKSGIKKKTPSNFTKSDNQYEKIRFKPYNADTANNNNRPLKMRKKK